MAAAATSKAKILPHGAGMYTIREGEMFDSGIKWIGAPRIAHLAVATSTFDKMTSVIVDHDDFYGWLPTHDTPNLYTRGGNNEHALKIVKKVSSSASQKRKATRKRTSKKAAAVSKSPSPQRRSRSQKPQSKVVGGGGNRKSVIMAALQREAKQLFEDGERQRAIGLLRARKALDQVSHIANVSDVMNVAGVGKGTIARVEAILSHGGATGDDDDDDDDVDDYDDDDDDVDDDAPSMTKPTRKQPMKKATRKQPTAKKATRKQPTTKKVTRKQPTAKKATRKTPAAKSPATSTKKPSNKLPASAAAAAAAKPPKPMLAKTYKDVKTKMGDGGIRGWFWSAKRDGIRASTGRDGRMYTRTGNMIDAPQSAIDRIPKGVLWDGELYLGRGRFEETNSMWRNANDKRWKDVHFDVFDRLDMQANTPVEERWASMRRILDKDNGGGFVRFVEQTPVRSMQHVASLTAAEVKAGGEGGMLRKPGSLYEAGKRSATLLKDKPEFDAEAKVIGHVAGKDSIRVSAVGGGEDQERQVKVGTEFSLSTGGKQYRIGDVVTYKYNEVSVSGKPKFATILRKK